MDLAGAERIGIGRTAEVYAWGEGKVLKLFVPSHPEAWAEAEHRLGAAAFEAGLPAPKVHGMERVGGRLGIVLERIEGPSLLRVLAEKPWRVLDVARKLAEIHAAIHGRRAPGLPAVKERLRWSIGHARLPDRLRAGAEAALARMPEGDTVCHGDMHPDNVVLTRRGPVAIDWAEMSSGHPLADVARTSLMLRVSSPPGAQVGRALELGRRLLHASYLRHYLTLTGRRAGELGPFLLPVGVARYGHGIDDEERALRAMLERLAA